MFTFVIFFKNTQYDEAKISTHPTRTVLSVIKSASDE